MMREQEILTDAQRALIDAKARELLLAARSVAATADFSRCEPGALTMESGSLIFASLAASVGEAFAADDHDLEGGFVIHGIATALAEQLGYEAAKSGVPETILDRFAIQFTAAVNRGIEEFRSEPKGSA